MTRGRIDSEILKFTESYNEGTNDFANGLSSIGIDLGWKGRAFGFNSLACVLSEVSSKFE